MHANTFGAAIKARRDALRLNQADVAERAGTTQESISRIEAGIQVPGLKLAMAIARALDTTVGALVDVPAAPASDQIAEVKVTA